MIVLSGHNLTNWFNDFVIEVVRISQKDLLLILHQLIDESCRASIVIIHNHHCQVVQATFHFQREDVVFCPIAAVSDLHSVEIGSEDIISSDIEDGNCLWTVNIEESLEGI